MRCFFEEGSSNHSAFSVKAGMKAELLREVHGEEKAGGRNWNVCGDEAYQFSDRRDGTGIC